MLAALAAAALPLAARPARAQVNAEALRAEGARVGWSGAVDARVTLLRGNTDLLDVGGAARVQYETLYPDEIPAADPAVGVAAGSTVGPAAGSTVGSTAGSTVGPAASPTVGPAVGTTGGRTTGPGEGAQPRPAGNVPFFRQRVFVSTSGRFAETRDRPFVSDAFAHARWTAMWHRRAGSDVFAQFQYDRFLRIDSRAIAGAGLRVDIVHVPLFLLWAGTAYMFEYNRVNVAPGAVDARETFFHRWTSYLTARLTVARNRLVLQNTLYIQPRFDAFADYRFLESFEVMARVDEHFSLGLALNVLYNSAPPTAVESTDVRLGSVVRASF